MGVHSAWPISVAHTRRDLPWLYAANHEVGSQLAWRQCPSHFQRDVERKKGRRWPYHNYSARKLDPLNPASLMHVFLLPIHPAIWLWSRTRGISAQDRPDTQHVTANELRACRRRANGRHLDVDSISRFVELIANLIVVVHRARVNHFDEPPPRIVSVSYGFGRRSNRADQANNESGNSKIGYARHDVSPFDARMFRKISFKASDFFHATSRESSTADKVANVSRPGKLSADHAPQ